MKTLASVQNMSAVRSPGSREAALSFDDIVAGMHEFRTTQDVIRSTFKALHDVIKNQGESIRNMQSQLETKLSKSEAQSLLAKKASVDAVNKSLTEVARVLDTKASLQDLEAKADLVQVETALAAKASGSEVRALRTSSATIASVEALREHFDHQLERVGASLAERPELTTVKSLLEGKASYVDVRTMLDDKADTAMVTRLLEDKASIKYMQQQLRLKNDRSDAERVEAALQSVQADIAVLNLSMARKADHDTVMSCIDERAPTSMVEGLTSRVEAVAIAADNQINACARTMDKRCSELEDALKQHAQKVVDRATDDLRAKVSSDMHVLNQSMQGALDSTVEEIDNAMKQLCRLFMHSPSLIYAPIVAAVFRADKHIRRADVEAALRIKVDRDEFSSTIAGVRETASETRTRLSADEEDIRREKQRLDLIEASVASKSGYEETENKLSTKANIEEVNASIVSVIEELDKKASLQVRFGFHVSWAVYMSFVAVFPKYLLREAL
jgi:uncharacterized protein YfcZ (UPF0381/DUF406 family)